GDAGQLFGFPHVAAHPPNTFRLHRTLLSLTRQSSAERSRLDPRDHARGFRLMARRGAADVRLLSRNGHDWSPRYSLIVEPVAALRVRSCLIAYPTRPPGLLESCRPRPIQGRWRADTCHMHPGL